MLYLDLDNTLIDTVKRLDFEKEVSEKYGLTGDKYLNAIDVVNERNGVGNFTIRKLFDVCREMKPDFPEEALREWMDFENRQIFFPDALDFIASFKKDELTLITAGDKNMQGKKIAVHNIEPLFSKILIVPSPKAQNIDPPPRGTIYIDDAPREIDAMKERFPYVTCVLVREPPPWEKVTISKYADMYCKDLKETFGRITNSE